MTDELDRALSSLVALAERKRLPTRHDARPILLEIGRLLGAGSSEALASAKRGLSAFPPAFAEAWSAAVREELSMAATEYVRSADPRYLGHAQYDWEYTIEARERLGWRLSAVQYLGITAGADLLSGIERVDHILEARRPGWKPNS